MASGVGLPSSDVITFLRDLSIIIAGGVITLWLFVLTIVLLMVYKRVNTTLGAIKETAYNARDSSKAIRDKLVNGDRRYGIAAMGIGTLAKFLFRSRKRRKKDTAESKGASTNGK